MEPNALQNGFHMEVNLMGCAIGVFFCMPFPYLYRSRYPGLDPP